MAFHFPRIPNLFIYRVIAGAPPAEELSMGTFDPECSIALAIPEACPADSIIATIATGPVSLDG